METMHGRDFLVDLQEWIGYDRLYTMNHIDKSSGLALLRKNNITIDMKFVD